jgi:hypothetical protein
MTGQTIIYRPDGSELITVTFDTDSYMRWQVMGEHAVTLNFQHAGFLEIPVGSYITYKGQRYTLYNPSDFQKNANRNYGYTLKLEAYQATMADSIFINIPDGRTSFSRTARPHEFLQSLADNLNREDSGWTVGAYIESVPATISFNEISCSEALRLMAEAFNTEWEVNGKEISLRKVEYFKDAPLALQYGKGNGFKPGLGRGNFDNSRPINRLFVRGGERNIDFSTYGSQTLLLPDGQSISYDGTYFQDEAGFNSAIARTYAVSGDGRSLIRTDAPAISKREGSVELTEIYPMREGTVTNVLWYYKDVEYTAYNAAYAVAKNDPATDTTGVGAIFCDIFDNTIPAALDYTNSRLDGEQMIVVFQTGMLAGREIGVQQNEESVTGYVHVDPSDPTKNRRFKLITEYVDGYTMPGGNFSPVVGDKYAVFGMKMPDAYVRDDATKSGASWDLFREAIRYKYENEDYRFTFKGEMDGIWAQANWDAIEDKIVAGGYVLFSDPQFQPEGVLIRIAAIKEYLHEPYKPTLELTNVVIGGGVRGELAKIDQQEVVIDERIKDIATLSNRQWRDTQELRRRLNDLHLGFTEAITPVSVQTMQLIAGSEQLQFRFVNNRTDPVEVRPTVVYDPSGNTLSVQGGIIQHMTLGIDAITGTHALSEYKFWNVDALTTEPLEEDKLYWLYARVPKTGTSNGTFVVTTDEMPFDTDPGYYNLLVGALNSEYDGDRSYTSLYGFTEVLPGQIIVNLIRSNDGMNYIDFVKNSVRIGNKTSFIDWNSLRDGIFRIKGAIVQSGDGVSEDVIGVFRGNFVPSATYYKGDEVFHNGTTYRYINDIPQSRVTPPNASYWAVRASAGKYTTYVYLAAEIRPGTPSTTELIPAGWSTQPPANVSAGQTVWVTTSVVEANRFGTWLATGWSTPVQWTGKDGEQGKDGRIFSYTGEYSSSKSYTGNSQIAQVVKVGSTYYYTNANSGTFSGVQPPNSAYWTIFGANFESVATDILFAKNGTLGSFTFDFATKEFRSAESTNGVPNIVLNSQTGEATFQKIEMGSWHARADGAIVNDFDEDNAAIIFKYAPADITAAIGTNVLPSYLGGIRAAAQFTNGEISLYGQNIGAYVGASGGMTNSALYIGEGFISGFAIHQKQIDRSYTVSHEDCHLSCYNTSAITITLPAPTAMQKGKVVYVRNMNGGSITIVGKIHQAGEVSSVLHTAIGNTAVFINDGQFWCYNAIGR